MNVNSLKSEQSCTGCPFAQKLRGSNLQIAKTTSAFCTLIHMVIAFEKSAPEGGTCAYRVWNGIVLRDESRRLRSEAA